VRWVFVAVSCISALLLIPPISSLFWSLAIAGSVAVAVTGSFAVILRQIPSVRSNAQRRFLR
jgi:hypothetical protein